MAFYYVYVACILGANAAILIPPRTLLSEPGETGSFAASWIVLHGLSLIVFVSLLGKQDSRNFLMVLAFGAFIAISALWSVAPQVTVVYGGMMVGNVLVAHLMASELSLHEIIAVIVRTLVALFAVGLIAYFLRFSQVYYFDIHQRPNILGGQPFKGFTAHKILAGLYATIGSLAVLATNRGWAKVFFLSAFALSVALTSSMVGVVLFAASVPLYFLVQHSFRRQISPPGILLAGGSLAVIAVPLAAFNWQQLLAVLSRDSTLTGRTTLWNLGMDVWERRPLLGWGFNAYLESPFSAATNRLFNRYGEWDIPHFHQSYIQTAVDLGLAGVLVLVGILTYILVAAYRYAIGESAALGAFMFTATIVMLAAGMVMFIFFNYNHFGTFLVMLLFFALRRFVAEERMRREEISRSSDDGGISGDRRPVSSTLLSRPRRRVPRQSTLRNRPTTHVQ